ncbi:MAG: IS21-like element helper ATPase IstB [Peptococcaceae bacterium]|jgi:DNA replication protein DnaC|nr:IS21-like element helper ATPase IstB [Peptococcaceae bacterium]
MQVHQLTHTLKQLRLGGMLDTLDIRIQQAETDRLGYLEFLGRLCEDEIQRRANTALDRRVARAHFDSVSTLATFDFNYNPKIPAATVRDLATCAWIHRHESVCLTGPVGVGKSHIAQAIGYSACQQGFDVVYRKASQVLQDLTGGHADGTFERRLRGWIQWDLIIVDDFGLRDLAVQAAEDLFELVCQRDQKKSWLIASNRSPEDWYELFPNPVIAEGILDRLVNSSYHVLCDGKSYRPQHRPSVQSSYGKRSQDISK